MVIANDKYEFIMCDIGANGRVFDGENTRFYDKLTNHVLQIPVPSKIEGNSESLLFVFIDFTLKKDFFNHSVNKS